MKKGVGWVIGILGLVGVGASFYIDHQVDEGEQKIVRGQRQVDALDSLTEISPDPFSSRLGKEVTAEGQKKIDKGREDVSWYKRLSGWLKVGGVLAIILGIALLVFKKKSVKK